MQIEEDFPQALIPIQDPSQVLTSQKAFSLHARIAFEPWMERVQQSES